MRAKLQYIYSILVFLGVLLTSYAMMSRDESHTLTARTVAAPQLASPASAIDPAVAQLLAVQSALSDLRPAMPQRSAATASAPTTRRPSPTPTPSPVAR